MDGENPLTLVRSLVAAASNPLAEGPGQVASLIEERAKFKKQLDKLYKSIICSLGGSDAKLMEEELQQLREDNRRMHHEIGLLQRMAVDYSSLTRDDLCLLLSKAESDLNKFKENLTTTQKEKRQLLTQKDKLVEQLKGLHATIGERDKEMTNCITRFKVEFEEHLEQNKKLTQENKALEKERWELMKKAKKLGEDKVVLSRAVEQRDQKIAKLQRDVDSLKGELDEAMSSLQLIQDDNQDQSSGRQSADITENGSQNEHGLIVSQTLSQSIEGQVDKIGLSNKQKNKKSGKRGSKGGSLSRIFSKLNTKTHDSDFGHGSSEASLDKIIIPTALTPEQQENWKAFQESKKLPLVQWKGPAIAAWLELAIGMAPYAQACRENIKSGRMLTDMTAAELEKTLGISNHLHKRKLRLALEDTQHPESCKYPAAGAVDHIWVAKVMCSQLGLPSLSDTFLSNLVDGRVLHSLTKEDLKRHLKITRKLEQLSILSGIELLRMHEFQKDVLTEERKVSSKPVYWTNEQVRQWLIDIDLKEYADNVTGSGLHGALLVFEQSLFTPEYFSSIIGIKASHLRKHLHTELNSLLAAADEESRKIQKERKTATLSSGGLNRTSSDATIDNVDRDSKIRWSLRETGYKHSGDREKRGSGTAV